MILHPKAHIGIGRDTPKIRRLVVGTEFVLRMVLRKATVVSRVGPALTARSQVCHHFFQLGPTTLYLDADKVLPNRRLNQDIYAVRRSALIPEVGFHENVAFEPSPFQDQKRRGRELANTLTKEARRKITPKESTCLLLGGFRMKQLALNAALRVRQEQSIFQTQEEIFRFLDSKRWINPQTRKRDCLSGVCAQLDKLVSQVALQFTCPVSLAHAMVGYLARVF